MGDKPFPTNDPPGPQLRLMALTTPPDQLHVAPDDEFPYAYGVLVDWPLGSGVASILAERDGTASLYTTAQFGIIGGHGHEPVRAAARKCVTVAGACVEGSEQMSEFPLPSGDQVYFYLLTYWGVWRRTGSMDAICQQTDPMTPLFAAAQNVLTQLRLVIEAQDAAHP